MKNRLGDFFELMKSRLSGFISNIRFNYLVQVFTILLIIVLAQFDNSPLLINFLFLVIVIASLFFTLIANSLASILFLFLSVTVTGVILVIWMMQDPLALANQTMNMVTFLIFTAILLL
ncbi:MAG: hypothetical protein ACRC5C_08750, partial [Bacilli bacterium]